MSLGLALVPSGQGRAVVPDHRLQGKAVVAQSKGLAPGMAAHQVAVDPGMASRAFRCISNLRYLREAYPGRTSFGYCIVAGKRSVPFDSTCLPN